MRTLRMIFVLLAFAAADLAVPGIPSALEATDQADDSGYYVSRRGASAQRMLRLPTPRTGDRVHVAPSPTGLRPLTPGRAAASRSIRKVPPVASDPAPALEDQP